MLKIERVTKPLGFLGGDSQTKQPVKNCYCELYK